jgi:spore coat polysaccharide biosynthesis protein SpsF
MKVGILILVRLGSTRLKNKHLIEVNGTTFLNYLISRFNTFFKDNEFQIIVATSNKPENKYLEKVVDLNISQIFYGSDRNIPLRQYQCAVEYGLTHIISVDGDDIFCSTNAALEVFKRMKNGAKGAKTIGLPIGLNTMGYELEFLKDSIFESNKFGSEIFETGWGRIFKSQLETIEFDFFNKEYLEKLRFTLDYKEDQLFFKKIIESYPGNIITAKDEEIIDFVISNNIYKTNMHLKDAYEANFNNEKHKEILKNEK